MGCTCYMLFCRRLSMYTAGCFAPVHVLDCGSWLLICMAAENNIFVRQEDATTTTITTTTTAASTTSTTASTRTAVCFTTDSSEVFVCSLGVCACVYRLTFYLGGIDRAQTTTKKGVKSHFLCQQQNLLFRLLVDKC